MFDKSAKIYYVNSIIYSTEGHIQSNSCNKLNFTDVTSYFQLQKNLPENNLKSNIQVHIFINS
jgi:hypothetical protein